MPWKWILALLWLMGCGLFSGAFFSQAVQQDAEALHLGQLHAALAPGAEVHVRGQIEPGPAQTSPLAQEECVAALVRVFYVTYADKKDKKKHDFKLITTRRVGPPDLGILVEGERLALPLERWEFDERSWGNWSQHGSKREMHELPPDLGVTEGEISRGMAGTRGSFSHFEVEERVLTGGMEVSVAGQIEPGAGAGGMRLGSDPFLQRVELYPGSWEELGVELHGSAWGLRFGGWVFLGIGLLPVPVGALLRWWSARR